ncbi:MAG: sulfotransferase domain-containing protein [Pseudomonadota bacterium]
MAPRMPSPPGPKRPPTQTRQQVRAPVPGAAPGGARKAASQSAPKRALYWLASYPKSGNTWTRIFLANYLFDRKTPMPINQVHRIGMGDAIPKAYAPFAGGPFDPTSHEQSITIRPRMLRALASGDADLMFVKTHNARRSVLGEALIPLALTRGAAYIIRHPLDVACSYARHYGTTPEEACEGLSRADHLIVGDQGTVPQYLGDWSEHVRSWTQPRDIPVLVLRYEDLLADPTAGFTSLLEHIGVPVVEERLARAVRFSSFDEVRAQEEQAGFVEKSPSAQRFFHAGGSGKWREKIAPKKAAAFAEKHRAVMERYGYTV